MKRLAALITGVVLAVSVAGSAMASSTCSAYNPQGCTQSTSTTVTPTTVTTSTLPFTGLDVALLLAGGAGLLGVGLVVRRI